MSDRLPGEEFTSQTYTYFEMRRVVAAEIARLYSSGELIEHSSGVTYFCLVPDGKVKIGYSKSLLDRLKKLSKDHGAKVHPLATLSGGYTREQCTHHQFRDFRIPVTGELFEPDPKLLAYAMSAGFCTESTAQLDRFTRWIPGERTPRDCKPPEPLNATRLVSALNQLDVPASYSRDKVRAILHENYIYASNRLIGEAIRIRRGVARQGTATTTLT